VNQAQPTHPVQPTQFYGTGRRKTSTARVFMRPGAGGMEVNGRTLDGYFPNPVLRMVGVDGRRGHPEKTNPAEGRTARRRPPRPRSSGRTSP
jgi:hypothetical protein